MPPVIRAPLAIILLLGGCGPSADPALEREARYELAAAVEIGAKFGWKGAAPAHVEPSPNGFGPWRIGCAHDGDRRVLVVDGGALPEPKVGDSRWFGYAWEQAGCR